jgi:hypothetical protein
MLNFKEKMILTGITQRISQKTQEKYLLVNFLGEDGQTFGCMADCEIPQGLEQLDKVEVDFKVLPGRYTQLKVLGLKKVV